MIEHSETVVNTTQTPYLSHAQITSLVDGGWVVTWRVSENMLDDAIRQQRFSADGTAVGGESFVHTTQNGEQSQHTITGLADGGWIVAWKSYGQDGDVSGVVQQRFDSEGVRVGGEVVVNTHTLGDQSSACVTSLADGGWLVTWTSIEQDETYASIYQQRFGSDGALVGVETRVSTFPGWQHGSQVVGLPDGGWLVVWASNGNAGQDVGIFQRQYSANGQPVSPEVEVSTFDGYQNQAAVTVLEDGGWIVSWASDSQDHGYQRGVYFQRFDAEGTAIGEETLANSTVFQEQALPDVIALPDGGWVITWTHETSLNGYRDIHIQRYLSNGDAYGDETRINSVELALNTNSHGALLEDGSFVITWQIGGQFGPSIVQRHFDVAPVHVGTDADDVLNASQQSSVLLGYDGNDTLLGNAGDDILNAGEGQNMLTGGLGADVFVFENMGASNTVSDFTIGEDVLDIRSLSDQSASVSFALNGVTLDTLRCFADYDLDGMQIFLVQNGANAELYVSPTANQRSSYASGQSPLAVLESVNVSDLGFDNFLF